jgi:hypothetical protein
MIQVRNITAKALVRQGQTITPRVDATTIYNADIEPGKSIRLFGTKYGKAFDTTFNIGDVASYDSYNLIYLGLITKITANTVTICERDRDSRAHRLGLYEFCWRNYDFNLERISADNHITMQHI